MATKKALAQRWRDVGGRQRAERLFDALERRASPGELAAVLEGLPHAQEVAGSLDLRGLEYRFAILLSGLDLSGARLDDGRLVGNIEDCVLAEASLDGFNARNATMRADFTRATFRRARLNGSWFDGAVLRGADLSGASLEQASLRGCDCSGAVLVGARLRFTTLTGTTLNGADLSEADLSGSTLDGARFDAATNFTGAVLSGARLDEDLIRFTGRPTDPAGPSDGFALAHFDATVRELELGNTDGHLTAALDRMQAMREQVRSAPDLDWAGLLEDEQFPDAVLDEIAEAAGEVDISGEE